MRKRLWAWVRWTLSIGWIYHGSTYKRCADGYVYLVGDWEDLQTGERRFCILAEAEDYFA